MGKRKRRIGTILFVLLTVSAFIGTLAVKPPDSHESIQILMRDAVLHEVNKISLFGWLEVNPGLISAFSVSGIFLVFALIVRIFVIPRFTIIPGKFQLLLETAVGFFENLAKTNSPHLPLAERL